MELKFPRKIGQRLRVKIGFVDKLFGPLQFQRVSYQEAKEIIDNFDHDIGGKRLDSNICKVSIVGVGMKSHSGVAATDLQLWKREYKY